jgi:glycosyltransferase involved in cell wall biosynthesis
MWVNIGLPYLDPVKASGRQTAIWGAGVDTDYFAPATGPKPQDFFIYFKSQQFSDLCDVYKYLFHEWFGLKGSLLMYYYYDHAMLLEATQKSRFCIMLNKTETQGLATLEILATGTPIFVIDVDAYVGNRYTLEGATSVPCWDKRCGMRSTIKTLNDDFPKFIAALDTYKPREFVLEMYSYKAAAGKLLEVLSRA